jgi:hypothetical protein
LRNAEKPEEWTVKRASSRENEKSSHLQVSGTMGALYSLAFAYGYDGVLPPYDHDPARKDDEHSLASVCSGVHEKDHTLAKFLAVGTPRQNVTALKEFIESGAWTEDAHTVLISIWNSDAALWFCRAVQSEEEHKEEHKEEQKIEEQKIEDAVPWDPTMMVMDCALLIRSVWWSFLAHLFVSRQLPLNRRHGSARY